MYPRLALTLPTSFRFPEKTVLMAMREILVPEDNLCHWCKGDGFVMKMGTRKLCTGCEGEGNKGGRGRNKISIPGGVFERTKEAVAAFAF